MSVSSHSVVRRWASFVVIATALATSSCGASEDAQRRTLNSVTCFESVEEKEAARTAAAARLNPPPLIAQTQLIANLEQASGAGYRVPALRLPTEDGSTTSSSIAVSSTTSSSATNSSTSTSAVVTSTTDGTNSSESTTSTSSSVAETSEPSTTLSTDESSTTSTAPTSSQEESSGSTPEELAAALQTIIDTPLCSALELNPEDESTDSTADEYVDVACPVSAEFVADYADIIGCEATTQITYSWTDDSDVVTSFGAENYNSVRTAAGSGTKVTFAVYVKSTVVASGTLTSGNQIEIDGSYPALASDVEAGNMDPAEFDNENEAEGTTECWIKVADDLSVSISCDIPLWVSYFYHTNAGGNENPVWVFGDESTTFGPYDDILNVYLTISAWNSVLAFNQLVSPGEYLMYLPTNNPNGNADTDANADEEDQEDRPLYRGMYTPSGTNTFTYPISEGDEFFAEFYSDCETQSLGARLESQSGTFYFATMPPYVLNDGLCGVWLWSDGKAPADETLLISVTADTSHMVQWSSFVDFNTVDRPKDITYDVLPLAGVSAPQSVQITIPEGGRWIYARGNSNEDCGETYDGVDPYLLLLDENGDLVSRDDDSGDGDGNCLASLIERFLEKGTYTLVATTYDLIPGAVDARDGAPTDYEVEIGIERRASDTSEPAEPVQVVTPPQDAINAFVGETDKAPEIALPVETIVTSTDSGNGQVNVVVANDVTNMMCDKACIDNLLASLGPDVSAVTVGIGDERVEIRPGDTFVRIPLRSRLGAISVSAINASGDLIFESQTPLVRLTPRVVPIQRTFVPYVNPSDQSRSSRSLPAPIVLMILFGLVSVGFILQRRQGRPQSQ